MTIIVGYEDRKQKCVYLGADSISTCGQDTQYRNDPKVFVTHGVGYAFCGSYRMGQVLRYHSLPFNLPSKDIYGFVVRKMIPMWKEVLGQAGGANGDDNNLLDGSFLVAVSGRLFCVLCDMQVVEFVSPFITEGSGYKYALGSLHTTYKMNIPIRKKVEMSIKTACEFDNTCGGKSKIIKVG